MLVHAPKSIIKKHSKRFFAVFLMMITALSTVSFAADHATVIMYHRFNESSLPTTNTTIEQFEAHLLELKQSKYNVIPLIDIADAIINNKDLPDHTVGISIDDAFLSLYKEAYPLLKEYGFPFTVFVATNAIDLGLKGYASWDQIREMQANGAHIGSQSHTHPHMHRISLEEAQNEIEISNNRFLNELGLKPQLFAYPYGEYTPAIRDLIQENGFFAAFGQHSGVMHNTTHPFEFPRFTFNEDHGSIDRLKLAVNALPIPAYAISPDSMILEINPPLYGFTISESMEGIDRVACFASGVGQVETSIIQRRVEVRLPQPFTGKRGRINCTAPYIVDGIITDRWRWLGRQFLP